MVIEDVEKVAEVVEKVATVAEKVSAEVAEILPDHTKLKDAAFFVERVSKETAHDAQLIENFIQKVQILYISPYFLVESVTCIALIIYKKMIMCGHRHFTKCRLVPFTLM